MIVILLVLLVGLLCGAALADRIFHVAATKASRRALEELECALDGLQSTYAMKAALLEAQQELAGLSAPQPSGPNPVLHLPPRRQSGV